jgi:hypothetical protein
MFYCLFYCSRKHSGRRQRRRMGTGFLNRGSKTSSLLAKSLVRLDGIRGEQSRANSKCSGVKALTVNSNKAVVNQSFTSHESESLAGMNPQHRHEELCFENENRLSCRKIKQYESFILKVYPLSYTQSL